MNELPLTIDKAAALMGLGKWALYGRLDRFGTGEPGLIRCHKNCGRWFVYEADIRAAIQAAPAPPAPVVRAAKPVRRGNWRERLGLARR